MPSEAALEAADDAPGGACEVGCYWYDAYVQQGLLTVRLPPLDTAGSASIVIVQ